MWMFSVPHKEADQGLNNCSYVGRSVNSSDLLGIKVRMHSLSLHLLAIHIPCKYKCMFLFVVNSECSKSRFSNNISSPWYPLVRKPQLQEEILLLHHKIRISLLLMCLCSCPLSRLSCILCCNSFPSLMREDWRDTKWTYVILNCACLHSHIRQIISTPKMSL